MGHRLLLLLLLLLVLVLLLLLALLKNVVVLVSQNHTQPTSINYSEGPAKLPRYFFNLLHLLCVIVGIVRLNNQ